MRNFFKFHQHISYNHTEYSEEPLQQTSDINEAEPNEGASDFSILENQILQITTQIPSVLHCNGKVCSSTIESILKCFDQLLSICVNEAEKGTLEHSLSEKKKFVAPSIQQFEDHIPIEKASTHERRIR